MGGEPGPGPPSVCLAPPGRLLQQPGRQPQSLQSVPPERFLACLPPEGLEASLDKREPNRTNHTNQHKQEEEDGGSQELNKTQKVKLSKRVFTEQQDQGGLNGGVTRMLVDVPGSAPFPASLKEEERVGGQRQCVYPPPAHAG